MLPVVIVIHCGEKRKGIGLAAIKNVSQGVVKKNHDKERNMIPGYSHSIVAGGLLEISYTTRFTPRTSFMILLAISPSTS